MQSMASTGQSPAAGPETEPQLSVAMVSLRGGTDTPDASLMHWASSGYPAFNGDFSLCNNPLSQSRPAAATLGAGRVVSE